MKICLVQPNTSYQVKKHRHALALTFPQMICNMDLKYDEYEIFVGGKTQECLKEFIEKYNITHVMITTISSTFPQAINYAKEAKECGCITVVGGIFASSVAEVIANNFNCFDYIHVGRASKNFIDILKTHSKRSLETPIIYRSLCNDNMGKSLANIMTNDKFTQIYNKNEMVCYELTQGCFYDCSFCTLRKAFGKGTTKRSIDVAKMDLDILQYWNKLKLIDDDIYESKNFLELLSCKSFEEVIAETRVDHINKEFMNVAQEFGITHIITGAESFNNSFIEFSNKSSSKKWGQTIEYAVDICNIYDIILRPVIMFNYPGFTITEARTLLDRVQGWIPENNIELLLSFYTPHPGLSIYDGELLSNDLTYFDHLNMVYIPNSISKKDVPELVEIYNQIVETTKSNSYNPPINNISTFKSEYSCFFE